jgi:Holliday junction DNA helicase RuvA
MIGYLKGVVIDIDGGEVIVEVNGVGYRVVISNFKFQISDEVELYIHTHVREDQISLFGFFCKAELKLFELLISVSGIGPKLGMTILKAGKADKITEAISKADVNFFTAISGIGKKGAQKIIIELKNKVGSLSEINLSDDGDDDLVSGLVAMGYNRNAVVHVMNELSGTLKDEDKIREALKMLGRK